eukprot:9691315-Ditylum_brightwellii.AAC.1
MPKGQLKETEPHELCGPEKHQRMHKLEPYDLCEPAKPQRVCARKTRVSEEDKNETHVEIKEPDPHKLCEPAMHWKESPKEIHKPEPHDLCEPVKHQKVCARETRVSEGDKNEMHVEMKEPEPHKLCEPAMHQGICTPELHNLCEPEQYAKVWCKYDFKPTELHSQTDERKRNQRGINNHPAVPISHPTHHDITHQNRPNS